MKPNDKVIIRNAKDNPALLASKVKKGAIATITEWHDNLCTGFVYIKSLGKVMPVTSENII